MPTPTATAAFRRALGRNPQRIPLPGMPTSAGKMPVLPPEAMYHFWYPERDGVEPCPKYFADQVRDIHRDLAICRPPMNAPCVSHPWLMWYRKPEVTSWISPGWTLLFCWQTRETDPKTNRAILTPLPLDARVFANLYSISVREFGSAEKYFDSVVKTLKNDKAKALAQDKTNMEDRKRDFMGFRRIKNIGRGNKFALHHDGSVVPTRGEANWTAETERTRMPGEIRKTLDDKRKQILSRRKERGGG